MAIDYYETTKKVNELNRIIINIIDMLVILERGTLINTPLNSVTLTTSQISGLKLNLKNHGDILTTLAGEIKDLIKA